MHAKVVHSDSPTIQQIIDKNKTETSLRIAFASFTPDDIAKYNEETIMDKTESSSCKTRVTKANVIFCRNCNGAYNENDFMTHRESCKSFNSFKHYQISIKAQDVSLKTKLSMLQHTSKYR